MAQKTRSLTLRAWQIAISQFENIELDVIPHEGHRAVIEITADESIVDGLSVVADGPNWNVSGPVSKKTTTITGVKITGNVGVGGRISVDGQEVSLSDFKSATKPPLVKMTIKLPERISLKLRKIAGDIVIGEVGSNMDIKVGGQTTLSARKIGDLKLVAEGGSALVFYKTIGKSITVTSEGVSSVKILAGEVETLTARTEGTSSFTFGGRAKTADLASQGSSLLRIEEVVERPVTDKSGSSRLSVGNWK